MILAPLSSAEAQLIGTNNIANGAVTAPKIANSAVTSTKIANNAVVSTKIANAAVTNAKIANLAVTEGKIVDGAVTGAKMAADAVTGSKIAAGAVTASKIAVGAVTSDKIAAGAITAEDIAAGAVTADKVATDAVSADGIAPDAVTADEIAAGAVTADEIGAGAVTADKIAPEAVTEHGIAAGAVTADKIFPESVFTDKIATGAVTPDKIAYYSNVVVVAPSGGNFTSPVDAMNAMPNDPSCASRYLVKIMPGVYDIGGDSVWMKPCVDIEGSGMHTTLIKGTVSTPGAGGFMPGVVTGASDAELRDLAVLNEGAAAAGAAVFAIKAGNVSGLTLSRVRARATGPNVNVGIGVVTKTFDLNPLEIEPVIIIDSDAYAGDQGSVAIAIAIGGAAATDTTAGTEEVLHAIVMNSTATAKGAAAGFNVGIRVAVATAHVVGGVASGDKAYLSDGGGGQVQGTLLLNDIAVKNNKARQFPLTIANCSAKSGTTLTVDNGTLSVTNSHFDNAVSMLNDPILTLLNSSLGGGVALGSGTFNAVNSSLAGAVTVTTGTANCAGVVRSDTFATLGASCQP